MRQDVRLSKDHRALRVDPSGQIQRGNFARAGAQLGRILRQRDGMQINNGEITIEFVRYAHPMPQRTQVIADCQLPRWLDTGIERVVSY